MDAMLRSRGIDPDTAADVKQHVAVRALERERQFQTRNGFAKWAVWVAWNRATDIWRADQRRVDPRPVPDDVAELEYADVEERARQRVALAQVAAALSSLTELERSATLAPLRKGYKRSSAADRDRRYEARAVLRRSVKDFPVVVPVWMTRRWWRRLASGMATAVPVAAVIWAGGITPYAAPSTAAPAEAATAPKANPPEDAATVSSTPGSSDARSREPHDGQHTATREPRRAPGPRIDVLVPNTPAGLHVATPPNDQDEPLLCTATFATPHTCIDLAMPGQVP